MLRAYKYRIYPNKEQKEFFAHSFRCVRVVYNLALKTKIYAYIPHKKSISGYDLCKQLTDLKKEPSAAFLKVPSSKILQSAILNLDKAYKNFFTRVKKGQAKGFPKFKSKFNEQSFQMPDCNDIDFKNKKLDIPKCKGIKIKLDNRICDVSKTFFLSRIKTVTISKTKTNKYFASILVKDYTSIPDKKPINNNSIGIDIGVKTFLHLSNNKTYDNKHYTAKYEKQLARANRKLARCKKGSNNFEKQKLRVAKIHEKIKNKRTDYLHKVSTDLIYNKRANTYFIENLNVSGMVQNKRLSKSIHDVGIHSFYRMLEYKAEWKGKNVKKINRFEPSSKMCSGCGNVKKKLSLGTRTYICKECGLVIDRDLNAARNIKNIGLKNYVPVGSRDFKSVEKFHSGDCPPRKSAKQKTLTFN